MKCRTGVDAGSGFVHMVEATAANVHDVTVAAKPLREDDEVVYRGLRKISTDYACSFPVQTCICLPGRAVSYAPPGFLRPLDRIGEGKWEFSTRYGSYTFIFAFNFDCLHICRGL